MGLASVPLRPLQSKRNKLNFLVTAGIKVSLVACLGFCPWAPAWGFDWDQALPSQASLVVLVTVGEKEVGAAEVLRLDGEFCLRVTDFAQFTSVQASPSEVGLAVVTPLGATTIPKEEIREVEGQPYLCEATLRKRLGTDLRFDSATVTLNVDVPWSVVAPVPRGVPLVPEIYAPRWGLGALHVDLNGIAEEGSFAYVGNAWVTGRALGGEWRVLAETAKAGETRLRELLWVSRKPQWFHFLGRDYVQLSPVMAGFDLVGAGFGWSNRRLPALGPWGSLTGFASTTTRSFRGPAPPGSFVKLRINGVVVASQQVGLAGRFEFLDVPVTGGKSSVNVEVEIYDRHNLLAPIEVRRFVTPTSWWLLPQGAVEVVGGLGMGGLWGRDLLGNDALLRKGVGYAALRWGVRENLTGEGMVQTVGHQWQMGVGLAWQVSAPAFTAVTVAQTNGAVAWNWEGAVQKSAWSLFVRALEQPQDFRLRAAGGTRRDYSWEARYNPVKWLEVGLWARKLDFQQDRIRWLRPTLVLALGNPLFLRVVPDQFGDYVMTATSQPHPRLRLSASYFHSQLYDVLWDLPAAWPWDLRGTFECGGEGSSRFTLSLGNRATSFRAARYRLGVMASAGHLAPYGEVSAPIRSGLYFRAQYLGIPARLREGERPVGRLFVSLTADFAYSMGSLVATDQAILRRELGGVAGRLVLTGKAPRNNLAGARVQVVGFGGTTTGPDGSFFLGNVPPGVYEVELDPEKLPLELVPLQRRFVVEVAAGTVTRVDFPLHQLFGLAGQVRTPDGRGVRGVRVVLLQKEKVVAAQEADAFGYFRFDQLEPGSYVIRVFHGEKTIGERHVVLEDFLFDQDVEVQQELLPEKPGDPLLHP